MTLQALLLQGLTIASYALGAVAIFTWWRRGAGILDGLGLAVDRQTLVDILAGLSISTAAMFGIFAIERLLGEIRTAPVAFNGPKLVSLAQSLIFYAAQEELLFRSLLLSGLLVIIKGRAWAAVLISGLVFGLLHASNHHASTMSVIGNGLGGVIYALAFVRTRRIWAPLALHFAWNYVQGPIMGFQVSGVHFGGLQKVVDIGPTWATGGAYGPEAGAVGIAARFLIIAAVLGWTHLAYGRGRGNRPAV
jgi:membrane protease YdiL (CAAX protease family)